MVGFKKIALFVMCLWSLSGFAQRSLWTEVSVNKKSVYQGEPIEVMVSVYTATWFTKGVNVQNIQVNNAFTVYFRSLSTSKVIKGKTYAGVQFFYNVFPYTSNNVEFPSLEISVETPNVDDYKGIMRKVKTKAKTITVKPIPPGFDPNNWLVTQNCEVTDRWSRKLNDVKVGDVIERSIYRSATNTVSELITPVVWDSMNGVSLYPDRASTENKKSKTDISASRTDRMRYLFEKEGEVIIPEMTLLWWNPVRKKIYKRTLKEVVIQVKANPDLGMLATLKDSLAMVSIAPQETAEEESFLLWGTPLDEWLKRVVVAIITYVLIMKIITPVIQITANRYQIYKNSERYYFNQIIWANLGWKRSKLKAIQYRWLDELDLVEPTVEFFWTQFGNQKSKSTFGWIQARIRYFKSKQGSKESNWINPE